MKFHRFHFHFHSEIKNLTVYIKHVHNFPSTIPHLIEKAFTGVRSHLLGGDLSLGVGGGPVGGGFDQPAFVWSGHIYVLSFSYLNALRSNLEL